MVRVDHRVAVTVLPLERNASAPADDPAAAEARAAAAAIADAVEGRAAFLARRSADLTGT